MTVSPATDMATSPSLRSQLLTAGPFAELSDEDVSAIEAITFENVYQAGETIYSLGQFDGSEFFVVLDGVLKVSQSDPETGDMLIDQYSKGSIFGLAQTMAELGGPDSAGDPAGLTLLASTDLTVAVVDAAAFRQLAEERATLTRSLMIYFAARLALGARRNESDASPERSVYVTLLKLVERDDASGEWRINRLPKHRELAEQAGAEDAVAAQAIAKIIQDGIAKRDYPGMIITDMQALNRLAD